MDTDRIASYRVSPHQINSAFFSMISGMRNGIRLSGGMGPRGRLELSSVNSWFNSTVNEKATWNAVCDEDLDGATAAVLLGCGF